MARPVSRWGANEITFIYICLSLGVTLKELANYFNTTIQNVHQVAKRNHMSPTRLRLKPEKVKQLWDAGALRFLF